MLVKVGVGWLLLNQIATGFLKLRFRVRITFRVWFSDLGIFKGILVKWYHAARLAVVTGSIPVYSTIKISIVPDKGFGIAP